MRAVKLLDWFLPPSHPDLFPLNLPFCRITQSFSLGLFHISTVPKLLIKDQTVSLIIIYLYILSYLAHIHLPIILQL